MLSKIQTNLLLAESLHFLSLKKEFSCASEKLVHEWAVWSLVHGKFEDPNGVQFDRTFVRSPGAVGVVALVGERGSREVVLVRQYRPPLDVWTLEIPAGMRDLEGEDPELTARRELEEEAGLIAGVMVNLGRHTSAPGISNSAVDLFVATDLVATKTDRHGPEEEFMTIETVAFKRCIEMIKSGEIQDGKTVIGLLLIALSADVYI